MPVNADGESASAASAVSTGTSSPTSRRSARDAVDPPGPGDLHPVRGAAGSSRPSRVSAARICAAGCGLRWPVPHRHRSAGHQRRGQERHGVGQVGFHRDRRGRQRARMNPPDIRNGASGSPGRPAPPARLHVGARIPQHLHGHRDVRRRRDPGALVPDLRPLLVPRRGEQQAGDELGGTGGVQGDAAARDGAPAVHRERDRAAAVVADQRAEFTQRREQLADRPLRSAAIAGELDVGPAQGGHRRDEAHHGAGVADVDESPAACPGVTRQVRSAPSAPGRGPPRVPGRAPRWSGLRPRWSRGRCPLRRARRAHPPSAGCPGPATGR